MRITDIAIAAIIGAGVGFAASHLVANRDGAPAITEAAVDARVDARIDARLAELGLEQKSDLDGRISGGVAQFLTDQPEAVVKALDQYQEQKAAQEEAERRQTVDAMADALKRQAGDPAIGADAATADVTLVEFFDYRCGYCKRSLETVMALAEDDPKLRVVFKEFPILGPESVLATRVSLAANKIDPSRYLELHAALMRHRGAYDVASLLAVTADVGFDPAAVEAMMNNVAVAGQIKNAYEVAEALGIRGTPAFIVGDRVIPGAVSGGTLKDAIEAARAADKG